MSSELNPIVKMPDNQQILKKLTESQDKIHANNVRVFDKAKNQIHKDISDEKEKLEKELKALKDDEQRIVQEFIDGEKGLDHAFDPIVEQLMASDKEKQDLFDKQMQEMKAKETDIDQKYDEMIDKELKQIWKNTATELNFVIIKHKDRVRELFSKVRTERNEAKDSLKQSMPKTSPESPLKVKDEGKSLAEKRKKNFSEFSDKFKKIQTEIKQKSDEISKLDQKESERLVKLFDKIVKVDEKEKKDEMEKILKHYLHK